MEIKEFIGGGSQSHIYSTFDPNIVVKVDQSLEEYNLLMSLDHPNIIKPLGYFIRDENYFIMLPTLDPVNYIPTLKQVEGIVSALDYLHENGILHNDVHMDNIMDNDGKLVLIDFGVSQVGYDLDFSQDYDELAFHMLHFMIADRNPIMTQQGRNKLFAVNLRNGFKNYGQLGEYLFQFLKL